MKYSNNALNILTAKSYKGVGNAWISKNLKGNESVSTIVDLLNTSLKTEHTSIDEFEDLKNNYVKKLLEKFDNESCDGIIALGDKNFPQYRGIVKESERPNFLYYKGDINLLSIQNTNISVIGLLNPESNIEERERKIVARFVEEGATIISGLAFGCDSISHQQALDSNGKTVAILPSPLNNILPARNKGLASQIVEEGGLLVTEYGTDFKNTMQLSSRYKERDRLQALFCDTIVLAASYAQNSPELHPNLMGQKLDSGARLAMGFAKNYAIQRAVMYDERIDKDNPMFDLNRALINEQENITIITQENFKEQVKRILKRKTSHKNETSITPNLFGL